MSFDTAFMGDVPGPDYVKPFHLFHYNKPKLPPLPKIKPVDYKAEPPVPVRLNYATKVRNKVIKETYNKIEDFRLKKIDGKMVTGDPEYIPRQTKTSQYRYKWVREVPVVSCRFTEHVMMYKKPPFTFQNFSDGTCGNYRLRRMKIKSPEPPEVPKEEKIDDPVFLGNILQ